MTEVIVDTNVAVVANGQNDDVVGSCRDACTRFIAEIPHGRVVLIDSADEIRAEYARAVGMGRPYQLGAQFLLYVLRYQHDSRHVRRIDLPKRPDGGFADFPDTPDLATFDPSDRKFAALARQTGVAVANATDSDWADHIASLNAHGVAVAFLCGDTKSNWFKRKSRR